MTLRKYLQKNNVFQKNKKKKKNLCKELSFFEQASDKAAEL